MRFVGLVVVTSALIAPAAAQNTDYFSTTITAPPDPLVTGCPTITATTNQCRTCAYPMCLVLTTVTQRCGCPKEPVTSLTSFPCDQQCKGIGCLTSWSVITATSCSSSSSLSSSSGSSSTSSSDSSSSSKSSSSWSSSSTRSSSGSKSLSSSTTTTKSESESSTSSTPTRSWTVLPPPPTNTVVVSGASRRFSPFKFW